MGHFDLSMHFRVIRTRQSAATVSSLVAELGAHRVLMVTDPGIQDIGLDRPLAEALREQGAVLSVFSRVEPNPTTDNVEQGLAQAREFKPRLLVALGGGSAMDCAKAINILLNRGGRLQDYAGPVLGGSALLPLVALPTTAGTGSEVSPFLLISDNESHSKIVIRDPQAIPKVAVLDPVLTQSLPPEATLYAGLDAMVHGFESYVALGSQPYSQALAMQAVELIVGNLPRVMAEPANLEARGSMLVAANLAGMAFSLSYLGLAHSLANALAKVGAVPHGMAVGMMLSRVIGFNSRVVGDQYYKLARHVLGDQCPSQVDASCEALADFVHSFGVRLGMPATLGSIGIKAGQIPALVEEALQQATIKSNPRNPSPQDLRILLQSAL
ncbi:MAG: iron-containing alcohol dehydrogenase family protein [Desulfomonilaceae bacterium]